ncbi:hypothetical protein PoB_000291600 [Plakobranchus ocellatus]|uniref:Uncharacterized protein n=1 Tax=Plakobranchus ocellatus TaxID=259542 RepID=A0AAV3Y001_9GAST|nr:hypothetical protein PoB_000291600 [Plakobranchus ocellatus]
MLYICLHGGADSFAEDNGPLVSSASPNDRPGGLRHLNLGWLKISRWARRDSSPGGDQSLSCGEVRKLFPRVDEPRRARQLVTAVKEKGSYTLWRLGQPPEDSMFRTDTEGLISSEAIWMTKNKN